MRNWCPTALATAMFLACLSPAHAQFARLSDAVKYRQAGFQVVGIHVQRLGAMAKGDQPFDKAVAESNALVVELLSRQLAQAFPPGSDTAPSKAKPDVWLDVAQFKSHSDQWQAASGKLVATARSGDANAFKAAYNAMAQTCKACHDSYRNR